MEAAIPLTPRARTGLMAVAAVGFVVANGSFVLGALEAATLGEALTNPVALAFVIEAFLLLPVLAWLLARQGPGHMHWGWFVGLSLIGSIAFALPVALLWHDRKSPARTVSRAVDHRIP